MPGLMPSPALLWIALAWYAVASLAAFIAFARDKRAAARPGVRRTREATLHWLELAGGWPGALLAIFALRHKNRKPSFLIVTVLIALAHACGWALTGARPMFAE